MHTFLAITYLLANFSHFSQQFRNQRKILRCFDTHIQILQRKSFYVILALFETLKPDSQETAQNLEKCVVLKKCLRITFYTYKPLSFFLTSKSLYPTPDVKDLTAGEKS